MRPKPTSIRPSFKAAICSKLVSSNKCDLHVGTRRAIASDDLRQFAVQRRTNEADTESVTVGFVKPPDQGPHLVDTFEHLDGLLVEHPPGLAEAQRPAATLDQDKAQFVFELLHLPAQRRLGDAQDFGSAGEVSLARDGNEIAQVPQLHSIPPRYCYRPI